MGQEIKIDDIISFEMTVRLNFKNCEVTVKRFGQILDIHVSNFSDKGYFTEKSDDFICHSEYVDLLNYLHNNIQYIEGVYKKTIEENTRNDDKITDFEDYIK